MSGYWLDSRPPARILGGVYVVAFCGHVWATTLPKTGGAGRSDWVDCADLVGRRSGRRLGGVRGLIALGLREGGECPPAES
jgi:hypothetical protein